jgi:hypothetical protein
MNVGFLASKGVKTMTQELTDILDKVVAGGHRVILGDTADATEEVQAYLARKGHKQVTVYWPKYLGKEKETVSSPRRVHAMAKDLGWDVQQVQGGATALRYRIADESARTAWLGELANEDWEREIQRRYADRIKRLMPEQAGLRQPGKPTSAVTARQRYPGEPVLQTGKWGGHCAYCGQDIGGKDEATDVAEATAGILSKHEQHARIENLFSSVASRISKTGQMPKPSSWTHNQLVRLAAMDPDRFDNIIAAPIKAMHKGKMPAEQARQFQSYLKNVKGVGLHVKSGASLYEAEALADGSASSSLKGIVESRGTPMAEELESELDEGFRAGEHEVEAVSREIGDDFSEAADAWAPGEIEEMAEKSALETEERIPMQIEGAEGKVRRYRTEVNVWTDPEHPELKYDTKFCLSQHNAELWEMGTPARQAPYDLTKESFIRGISQARGGQGALNKAFDEAAEGNPKIVEFLQFAQQTRRQLTDPDAQRRGADLAKAAVFAATKRGIPLSISVQLPASKGITKASSIERAVIATEGEEFVRTGRSIPDVMKALGREAEGVTPAEVEDVTKAMASRKTRQPQGFGASKETQQFPNPRQPVVPAERQAERDAFTRLESAVGDPQRIVNHDPGMQGLTMMLRDLPDRRTQPKLYERELANVATRITHGVGLQELGLERWPGKEQARTQVIAKIIGLADRRPVYFDYAGQVGVTVTPDGKATGFNKIGKAIEDLAAWFRGGEPTLPKPKQTSVTGIKLQGTSPYLQKDQAKADVATKFIGVGQVQSSTANYAKAFGAKANSGQYTSADKVFVSAEGNRPGRLKPNFAEIERAIKAGATIITDIEADRARAYNIGEREVEAYLMSKELQEVAPGRWRRLTDREVAAAGWES